MNRIFPLMVLICLLVSSTLAPASVLSTHAAGPGGLTLLSADAEGVTINLQTPQFESGEIDHAGTRYQQLTVPGYGRTQEPGRPSLPQVSALIGVPPGAQVQLEVLHTDTQPRKAMALLEPAVAPAPLQDELQPGEWQIPSMGVGYQVEGYYPAQPAAIVEEAWIRDQRVVRLALYPFQYNPARGELLWHRQLQVRVHFQSDGTGGARSWLSCTDNCKTTGPFDSQLDQNLLNAHQARAWRGRPAASSPLLQSPRLTTGPTSTATAYKIVVDQDGLYRLTYEDLESAGMNLDEIVEIANLHLTSQGQAVAYFREDAGDGSFDPGDSLLFYGEKFRGDHLAEVYADTMEDWIWLCAAVCDLSGVLEKYTDENVYWLTVEEEPGLPMLTDSGEPAGAPVPDHYTATVHLEETHAWYTYHFLSEDTWFWERIHPLTLPATRTYTATLSALASTALTATVRAEMVARSLNDPHTQVFLNGNPQPLEDEVWDNWPKHEVEADIPQSQLLDGDNTLTLTLLDTGARPEIFFDWFEITFGREFQAIGDELHFSFDVPGTWQFQVEGLDSAAVRVLDITHPLTPTLFLTPTITDAGGTYTVAFEEEIASSREYYVAGSGAELSPKAIQAYTPEDFLGTAGAEYVLITHPDLITETQRLADYRAEKGLSTRVVSVMELYDQFNFGIYHPIAIKNFLAFTFEHWTIRPDYVVLVGGGHWNLKGVSDYAADPIYMPPNLAFVDHWQGEVDSANLLAAVVGDDIFPDVMIARMPANSPAELAAMIDKIMAYEVAPFLEWQRRHLFVTDDSPDPGGAGNFNLLAEGIINDYLGADPGLTVDRVYLNDHSINTITQVLLDALNTDGASLVNYIGHGSRDYWAHTILSIDDVPDFQNGDRLPVVLSMTCLDGYWIYPGRPGLVSTLLSAPGKGAVATFSATGLGVATGHDFLHRGFYSALFDLGEWRLGLAAQNAKLNLFTNGNPYLYDLIHTFTVFGDPALKIHGNYIFLPAIQR